MSDWEFEKEAVKQATSGKELEYAKIRELRGVEFNPIQMNISDEIGAKAEHDPDAAMELLEAFFGSDSDAPDVATVPETPGGLGGLLGKLGEVQPSKTVGVSEWLMDLISRVRPTASQQSDVLRSPFSIEKEFYEIGEPQICVVYVPIFQSLCQGDAAKRFTSSIEYSEGASTDLAIDMSLKGLGANLSSSNSFNISFTTKEPVIGSFQLSLPAIVETRTYRHRANDDLTGTRTSVIEVGSEATLIMPQESDFVSIEGLSYRPPTRFGALRNLVKTGYEFESDQSLKGTIGFPLFKEIGEFGLEVTVTSNSGIGVTFETTKEGVFEQKVGADGPLSHIFNDENLRQ